jgi:integrase
METTPHIDDTRLAVNAKTGYYEVRWSERDPDGRARTRTYSTRTKDRDLAEQVRATWLNAADHVAGMTLSHTVGDLIERYERGHVQLNGVSAAQLWALKPVKKYFGGDLVADVTSMRVAGYRRTRATRVQDGTIRRELGALRAVLNWAVKVGELPTGVTLPYIDLPPASQARENYLDWDEEQRLWDVASTLALDASVMFPRRRIGYFICIALETAARSAAIETLRWDRVDFARGLIDFREPGRKVSKKRRVAVPISDRLRPVLEDLFVRRDPNAPFVLGHAGKTLNPFVKFRHTHGFDGLTRHDLRRTWATLRAQQGVSMFDIAGVLGDNVETVLKHYAHHSPDHLRAAVNIKRP